MIKKWENMTRDEIAGKQTAHLVVRTGEIAEDVGQAKKSKKRVKNSKKTVDNWRGFC